MRIWMHLIASIVACFGGFFAGGLLLALLLEWIRQWHKGAAIPTMVLAAIVFIFGGLRLGEWLVRQLSARCPNCRGAAYAEGHRPIRYRCSACGHIHYTNMRTNWGQD